jgi:MFS family permease
MLARFKRVHVLQTAEARRLALLFAIVYFAEGMWFLPVQTLTIVFKDRGLSAGEVATFNLITTIPWFVKPVYGLLSDFVPLFGRRRKSYLLLTSLLAGLAGLALGGGTPDTYWWLAALFTTMALGVAFTDVLVDALMVETGKPRGLTGAFQSVQWAAISAASILVGVGGGYLAGRRRLSLAFLLTACFPLISFLMTLFVVREAPARTEREAFRQTWAAIREALRDRDVWVVAGFIFFVNFSPSLGPALLYYQTDALKFSQEYIGVLTSLGAAAGIVGALVYAPLSRGAPLTDLINLSIGTSVLGTLAYLFYRGAWSALVVDTVFGGVAIFVQVAFLDLAAKSCPRRVEATFFALLMSVSNAGTQGSQWVGGHLYDWLGYVPLILISAAFTALAWPLVPLVKIDRIEARAREATETSVSAS